MQIPITIDYQSVSLSLALMVNISAVTDNKLSLLILLFDCTNSETIRNNFTQSVTKVHTSNATSNC